MKATFKTTGMVDLEPKEMAELVTTTLQRLGYKDIHYAKKRAEFTAVDRDREMIYTDVWSHH